MADSILHSIQQVQAENALLQSQGLEPKGFGALIEAGSLENIFGGDQQVPAPQQDLQQILTDQFDPRSVDPLGISGVATGQTGAESLRFGTPPPDLLPVTRSKQSQEQVTRSLARLQTLDPTGNSAKFALGLIANRNAQDLSAAKAKMDEVFKETTNLLRIKDPVAQERQIIQTIRERTNRGIASPALQKILELPLERRVVGLEQRKVIATDVKTLATNEQKELDREQKELDREQIRLDRESKERIAVAKLAAQPGQETFTEVKDAQGNIIGQRSSLTGKVVTDPRTPKPATKTSLIQNLEAIGIDPLSAEGKDIVKKSLTKPGVKINLNEGLDFKIPPGFILLDKSDPAKGITPIPGGPKDNLTSENAAKTQMLQTAQKAFKGTRSLIFDKKGGLDRINLFNAQFNTPFTDGRKLRNKMEFGIQAITRLETGAAMPENEVENTRTRFMPTIGDTVEIANTKLQMFEDFLGGTLKLIDPSGRFNAERFDSEFKNRLSGVPGGQPRPKFTIKRVR